MTGAQLGWAAGRMCGLDFESSDREPLDARIIQAACVDITPVAPELQGQAGAPAVEVDRWANLVWPGDGFVMPDEAFNVHKISTERCREEGIPTADAVEHVITTLHAVWDDDGVVVGHNVGRYDLPLLAAEASRLGMPRFEVRGCVIDTLILDKCDLLARSDRFRKNTDIAPDGEKVGSRKLVDQVRWWRVRLDPDRAHDATEDALAAARVAYRMCQRYPALAVMDLDELHAYQARQAFDQAESLEKYLRRKAKEEGQSAVEVEAIVCAREWPIRYGGEQMAFAS